MIIGLCGRARSGKTTAAEAIVEHARSLGLTAEIYDIGQLILRYCIEHGRLPNKKREDLEPEELQVLVDVGREKREEYQNYWADRLFIAILQDSNQVSIIPNIRFENEVAEVRERGGFLIRLTSLNPDGSEYISRDRDPNDPSETTLHAVNADHHIVVKRGESALIGEIAATIFEYRRALS